MVGSGPISISRDAEALRNGARELDANRGQISGDPLGALGGAKPPRRGYKGRLPEQTAHGRDTLAWWLQQMGVPHSRFKAQCPDYLIISPPKTGSTWLADNLRRHPQIFVPSMKEIKYFSSYYKALDLSWYLDQIAPGEGRIKGEASPSYALLPVERIELIRLLMPEVKIVFLMRDPIGRAWSHAKHNYRYREANFTGTTAAFDAVGDREWMDNFTEDWTLASGDYLGQLRRWLSVFPREQMYIGFFESIANQPETLLREVLTFLGADGDVDLGDYPLRERILPGLKGKLSPILESSLHGLLYDRTRELADFLRTRLDLAPPAEWRDILASPKPDGREPVVPSDCPAFVREWDDRYLAGVLEQEEAFPSAWCPVIGAYQGFNLVYQRGLIYALDVNLGNISPAEIGESQLRLYRDAARCFVAPSLAEVKARIDQHVFDRTEARLAELPALHRSLANLERVVENQAIALRQLENDLHWLRPWLAFAHRVFRPAWQRLRAVCGRKRPAKQRAD